MGACTHQFSGLILPCWCLNVAKDALKQFLKAIWRPQKIWTAAILGNISYLDAHRDELLRICNFKSTILFKYDLILAHPPQNFGQSLRLGPLGRSFGFD